MIGDDLSHWGLAQLGFTQMVQMTICWFAVCHFTFSGLPLWDSPALDPVDYLHWDMLMNSVQDTSKTPPAAIPRFKDL